MLCLPKSHPAMLCWGSGYHRKSDQRRYGPDCSGPFFICISDYLSSRRIAKPSMRHRTRVHGSRVRRVCSRLREAGSRRGRRGRLTLSHAARCSLAARRETLLRLPAEACLLRLLSATWKSPTRPRRCTGARRQHGRTIAEYLFRRRAADDFRTEAEQTHHLLIYVDAGGMVGIAIAFDRYRNVDVIAAFDMCGVHRHIALIDARRYAEMGRQFPDPTTRIALASTVLRIVRIVAVFDLESKTAFEARYYLLLDCRMSAISAHCAVDGLLTAFIDAW